MVAVMVEIMVMVKVMIIKNNSGDCDAGTNDGGDSASDASIKIQ